MSVRSDRLLSDYFKKMANSETVDDVSGLPDSLENAEKLLHQAQMTLCQEALLSSSSVAADADQSVATYTDLHTEHEDVTCISESLPIATSHVVEQDCLLENTDKEILPCADTQEVSASETFIPLEKRLPKRFQALFFEVAGLTLALPLIELGGIHRINEITPLPGKAKHQLGVFLKNGEKFQCVDTTQVIMPEKVNEALFSSLDYSFGIQLGKTKWILACEALKDTEQIGHDQVNWRNQANSRQWLAGMIKNKMCALIDAEKLVELLNHPLESR